MSRSNALPGCEFLSWTKWIYPYELLSMVLKSWQFYFSLIYKEKLFILLKFTSSPMILALSIGLVNFLLFTCSWNFIFCWTRCFAKYLHFTIAFSISLGEVFLICKGPPHSSSPLIFTESMWSIREGVSHAFYSRGKD